MKRIFSVTALFLAVAMLLLSFGACGKDSPEGTVSAQAQTTAVPSPGSTGPAGTSDAPETTASPVLPPDVPGEGRLSVWKSGLSESLLSGTEEALLQTRAERFLASSGLAIRETVSGDLVAAVTGGALSGEEGDLLLLHARSEGIPLFCAGLLQNLSAPGIDITAASDCVVSTLAEDLTVDGKLYLVPFRGLVSDVNATYAVSIRDKTEAQFSAAKAISEKTYSLESLLQYLKQWEETDPELFEEENGNGSEESRVYEPPVIGGGNKALEALFAAAGGRVMAPGGMPKAEITSLPFSRAFTAASPAAPYLSDREEIICISVLSERNPKGRTLFPLPPISSGAVFVTPVEADTLTVMAATGELMHGQQMADLLGLLSDLSADLRARVTPSGEASAQVLQVLFSTQRLDLAKLYTWGDLYDLVFSYLGSAGYSALANDPDLDRRLKTASTAAEIVRSRY